MANEVATATDLEDLFGRIVSFVSTNATLVAAGQNWQILRQRRDNLAALTSSLTDPADVRYRTMAQTCRYEARTLNSNDESGTAYHNNFYAGSLVTGTSYVKMQLRTARAVATVRLRAPQYTTHLQYMLRNFRLQYSDDGTAWTTALTVSASTAFTAGEVKDYAVGGSPGSHLYWQIVIDSVQSGTTVVTWQNLLLLEADGTVANHFGSEALLKGPGVTASDEIFVGLRAEYYGAGGWYNLFLNGYTGFSSSEESFFKQPGALPGFGQPVICPVPMVPCWNAAMPYWLVADGRCIRFAVKVGTSYGGGYLGYFLPYATPGQYPYPLAVGGSLVPQDTARSSEWRYSYVSSRHAVYPMPGADSYPVAEGRYATLYARLPDGSWKYFANRPNSGGTSESYYGLNQSNSPPYAPSGAIRGVWPHTLSDQFTSGKRPYRECLGGGYLPQPCILMQNSPSVAVFGELAGTYAISGYANTAENTFTLNGVPGVVFQNAYRNSVHEHWALMLD